MADRDGATVMIAAGGTGGHVFPGLAVAEQLREQQVSVLWLGTRTGLESRVVPASEFAIHFIDVSGVRGKNLSSRIAAVFKLFSAVLVAIKLIRRQQVNAVLGLGGYVSVAAGIAAVILRKPLLLQEQNAVAGTANRLLAPFARKIFTGFEGVFTGRRNVVVSGNPLRASFCNSSDEKAQPAGDGLKILVLGGSLGAHRLNQVLPEAIGLLGERLRGEREIKVRHQCGKNDVDSVSRSYSARGIDRETSIYRRYAIRLLLGRPGGGKSGCINR